MKTEYVYIMTDGERHKIGISRNPAQRTYQVAADIRSSVTLVGAFKCESRLGAQLVEERCHRDLAEHQDTGEWFNIDEAAARSAIANASQGMRQFKEVEISAFERAPTSNSKFDSETHDEFLTILQACGCEIIDNYGALVKSSNTIARAVVDAGAGYTNGSDMNQAMRVKAIALGVDV